MTERILLLHPGAMGASVGAALRGNGHAVSWLPAGRSAETAQRAQAADLAPADTLAGALAEADAVLSVCPPHAAVTVAETVAAEGFAGLYVDANAVSPATAARIRGIVGVGFVDGGIIGPPAWRGGQARLYLSGCHAERVAAWFAGSPLEARPVPGSASALKMCYAAYTKGSAALLLAIRALAAREGVSAALLEEWGISQPGLGERSERSAAAVGAKAWRFEGEMREIAATFAAAGLPDGFHAAAAEMYRRLAPLKDAAQVDVAQALALLTGDTDGAAGFPERRTALESARTLGGTP